MLTMGRVNVQDSDGSRLYQNIYPDMVAVAHPHW